MKVMYDTNFIFDSAFIELEAKGGDEAIALLFIIELHIKALKTHAVD